MLATILIIEDNKDLREVITEVLELENYKVHAAENGRIGLEIAKELRPDLIVCDINMPELDGYDFQRQLNSIPELADTPLIFITGRSGEMDSKKESIRATYTSLIKPFTDEALLKAIRELLKN